MNNQNNLKKKEKNVAKRLLGNMQEKHFWYLLVDQSKKTLGEGGMGALP